MEASTNRHRLPDPKLPGKALSAKLVKVIGSVTNVPKNGWNDFHKYAFARAEDVLAVLRSAMAENALSAHTTVLDHGTEDTGASAKSGAKEILSTVVLAVSVIDSDSGESCTSYYIGQGVDKGDKAYYKAYTGALKYALQQLFLLPMGDDPEGDVTVDQRADQAPAAQQLGKRKGNTTGSPARNQQLKKDERKAAPKPVQSVPPMIFADGKQPEPWTQETSHGITAHQYEFLVTALHGTTWAKVQGKMASRFEGCTELVHLSEQQAQVMIDGITGINQAVAD